MLHTRNHLAAGIAALALGLGTAAPAVAMPIDLHGPVSNGSAVVSAPPRVQATSHHSSDGGTDWDYLAAGTGAVSLALLGIGGAALGRERRTRRSTATA